MAIMINRRPVFVILLFHKKISNFVFLACLDTYGTFPVKALAKWLAKHADI